MDLPPSPKDPCAVLGFLAPLCRSPSHDHQQVQHGAAASADRGHDRHALGYRRCQCGYDRYAVSSTRFPRRSGVQSEADLGLAGIWWLPRRCGVGRVTYIRKTRLRF